MFRMHKPGVEQKASMTLERWLKAQQSIALLIKWVEPSGDVLGASTDCCLEQ